MKRSIYILLLTCAFLCSTSTLHAFPRDIIPRLHFATWQPLAQRRDADLQNRLRRLADKHPIWCHLLKAKKMAVGMVDLSDPSGAHFASINGNDMMYAASLPKIAILLTAFDAFQNGSLKDTEAVNDDLNAMIRVSSNLAATRMINRLGFARIAAAVTDPRYHLYDPAKGGGLWVGKRYSKNSERHPDPLLGLSHAATANQVCRFYYLLASGKLINPTRSAEMLEILSDSMIHLKFVKVLEKRAPQARLFRKSGNWRNYYADSVLVWGPQRHYILVGLVHNHAGERILENLGTAVDRLEVSHAAAQPVLAARADTKG